MNASRRNKAYNTATEPSSGRLRRVMAVCLSILVLAFNIAAAGAMPVSMGNFAAPQQADNVSVICTTAGMVVIDKNGTVIPTDRQDVHGVCAFCLPLLHGDVTLPLLLAKIERPQPVKLSLLPVVAARPAAASRLRGTSSPRAPPSLV